MCRASMPSLLAEPDRRLRQPGTRHSAAPPSWALPGGLGAAGSFGVISRIVAFPWVRTVRPSPSGHRSTRRLPDRCKRPWHRPSRWRRFFHRNPAQSAPAAGPAGGAAPAERSSCHRRSARCAACASQTLRLPGRSAGAALAKWSLRSGPDFVVLKDRLTPVATAGDVIQGTCKFDAQGPGHAKTLAERFRCHFASPDPDPAGANIGETSSAIGDMTGNLPIPLLYDVLTPGNTHLLASPVNRNPS